MIISKIEKWWAVLSLIVMFWMASGSMCKVCLEFLLLCFLSRNNAERSINKSQGD